MNIHYLTTMCISLFVRICILFISSILSLDLKYEISTVFGSLQQDINISCPLNGQGLIWSIEPLNRDYDRKIIRPSRKYTFHRSVNCPRRVLQINSLTEEDEQIYACFTTNAKPRKFKIKLVVPITGVLLRSVNSNDEDENVISGIDNQSLIVSCSVTKSRPRPYLFLYIETNNKEPGRTKFEPSPAHYKSILQADGSFITQTRFKTNHLKKEDDQSNIVCEVTLAGISRELHNVRETRELRVYYPPECRESRSPIFLAVNRTNSISCPVVRANPTPVKFRWNTGIMKVEGTAEHDIIKVRPHRVQDIKDIACFVNNGIGSEVMCTIRVDIGAKPDPVSECHWSYPTNQSLQIGCKLGFNQGDRNQQCVLYKEDNESGLMSEYARSQKCSFLIEPTYFNEIHRIKIFSINKYGDSLQDAVSIEINIERSDTTINSVRNKRIRISFVFVILFFVAITFVVCCWYSGGGSDTLHDPKRQQSDKFDQISNNRLCYRRALKDIQNGDPNNLLLPLVNNVNEMGHTEMNGHIPDSSTVSSYLPTDGSQSIFHTIPDTPPPISARNCRLIDFAEKIQSQITPTIFDNPPSPSPRYSVASKDGISKKIHGGKCFGSIQVTDC